MSTESTELRMSQIIESIRSDIARVRSRITDFKFKNPGWKERVDHVEGLLTCGIVTLASSNEEIIKFEIDCDDRKFGPSFRFSPRGIGLDSCPCCFVCGKVEGLLNNISGFVWSKEDGEQIVSLLDGRARLDFRPSEPNWIQVKIGSCDEHLPNLKKLMTRTAVHGRIRRYDVDEAQKPETTV